MAALVCDYVEEHFATGTMACGLVADLVKSFNLIPRHAVHTMRRQIGIPETYLTAHMKMLDRLERFLEVSGQTADSISSCRRVPEGCGHDSSY